MDEKEILIDGIPFHIKKETLINKLKLEVAKQKEKLLRTKEDNKPDKNEKVYRISYNLELLDELISIDIIDLIDYEYVDWCFNYGHFRNADDVERKKDEVRQKKERIRIDEIRSSEAYQKHYHPFLFFCLWFFGLPLIIAICWDGFRDCIDGTIFYWAMGLLPFSIIAAIATWVYCNYHAYKFKIPMSDFAKEALVAGTVTGCTLHYYDRKRIDKENQAKRQEI